MDMSIVQNYQEQFEKLNAFEMLSVIMKNHPGKVCFSSSLSAEDQIITHMLCKLDENPDIFSLDTGRLFYDTYDLIDRTNKHFGIKLRVMFPDSLSVEEMVQEKGINLFYHSIENRKRCCYVRKIEPLQRALKGNEVWITGLRIEQSVTRNSLHLAEWDENNKVVKVNPLLYWSEGEVWDYIKKHNIPYNPLHDQGYPSLGCKPCTRAISPDEDIRAGRWWWENPETKECGLHKG